MRPVALLLKTVVSGDRIFVAVYWYKCFIEEVFCFMYKVMCSAQLQK